MEKRYFEMSQMFKALCDENRIKIVEMLIDGELCAADILKELEVTQPTLSHHMKTLCDAGLVEYRKSGKWVYYRISKTACQIICEWLGRLAAAKEGMASVSLEKTAMRRTEKILPPRKTVAKKKTNKIAKKPAEEISPKEEKVEEAPRRREIDIVIL